MSIDDLFDQAWQDGVLHQIDLYLRQKVFFKFAGFKHNQRIKLFYNLDNRLFDSKDYDSGKTADLLKEYGK
ncbi:MAG: hypothetical protein ABIJ59_02510 [Pseudomonadota bacterium]